MKRAAAVQLVLGVLACVVTGSALLLLAFSSDSHPRNAELENPPLMSTSLASSAESKATVAQQPAVTIVDEAPAAARDVAPRLSIEPSVPPSDDIDAMLSELASLRTECSRLKSELERCRAPLESKACKDLARSFDECRFPERTPMGALLRVPEYDELSEKDRREVEYTLDDYPVLLQAGEAAWIAERWRQNDWHTYGRNLREALILFLGPARVAREMPPHKLEQLRERCDDLEWARLFGTVALPR